MEKYSRLFVKMSLIYLFIGISIALYSILVRNAANMRFMHVHFNLLGFLTMMVAGVGYHILPRFNGTPLYFPKWVSPHFWLSNVGLIILTNAFHMTMLSDYPTLIKIGEITLIIGGVLSVAGLFMFIINMLLTLKPQKQEPEDLSTPKAKPVQEKKQTNWIKINPTIKVADLVEKYPGTLDILVEEGKLTPLAQPGHIDRIREMGIVLGSAITSHGGDVEYVISKLEDHINSKPNEKTMTETSQTKKWIQIDPTALLADLVETYPGIEKILIEDADLTPLSQPGYIDQAREIGTTIGKSLVNCNANIRMLIDKLEQFINSSPNPKPFPKSADNSSRPFNPLITPRDVVESSGSQYNTGHFSDQIEMERPASSKASVPVLETTEGLIDKSMRIGQVLAKSDDAKDVFKKFFGEGCFSCPSQSSETVEQAAQMHNVSVDVLLGELNRVTQ